MDTMMVYSTLANELRLIYHGLTGGIAVNMMINNRINFSIPFHSYNNINNKKQNKHIIAPHETLLLIGDKIDVYCALLSILGLTPNYLTTTITSENDIQNDINITNIKSNSDNSSNDKNNNSDKNIDNKNILKEQIEYEQEKIFELQLKPYISPQLLQLISYVNPTTTLESLCFDLDLTIDEVIIYIYIYYNSILF
jgi:hypothetical protein